MALHTSDLENTQSHLKLLSITGNTLNFLEKNLRDDVRITDFLKSDAPVDINL